MSKAIQYLALLLLVQLAVILGLQFSNTGPDADSETQPLITDISAFKEITITDKDHSTKALKTGDGWTLQDYANLPTAEGKIQALLDNLSQTKASWPTASSVSAAERFEVAEGNAQKTVVLSGSETDSITLYLGTSPSYRKLHIRKAGSNDIFVVELAQHDISAQPENWLDKTLLQAQGDITGVRTDSFTLSSSTSDDGTRNWQLDSEAPINNASVSQWVERFNTLQVSKLVNESDNKRSIVAQNPVLTVTVTTDSGSRNYVFYQHESNYFVKLFGEEPVFEIATYQAEPIVNVDPKNFNIEQPSTENMLETPTE